MKTKFITFRPCETQDYYRGWCKHDATEELNRWLEVHPNVEILSWQTTPVGTTNELYITIQYKEN